MNKPKEETMNPRSLTANASRAEARASRLHFTAFRFLQVGVILGLVAWAMKVPEFAIGGLGFLVTAGFHELQARSEERKAKLLRREAINMVRHHRRGTDPDRCCDNERRDMNGGCVNCGAPCL